MLLQRQYNTVGNDGRKDHVLKRSVWVKDNIDTTIAQIKQDIFFLKNNDKQTTRKKTTTYFYI